MKNLKTTLLSLTLSLTAIAADVPGIMVEYVASGTQAYVQAISAIGRIEFTADHATVVFKDATAGSQDLGSLSSIQRIAFGAVSEDDIYSEDPTSTSASLTGIIVSAYPNPVADHLHVSGIADGQLLRLFAVDGKLVFSGITADIDMNGMPSGVYFLQAGQELVKIIKK